MKFRSILFAVTSMLLAITSTLHADNLLYIAQCDIEQIVCSISHWAITPSSRMTLQVLYQWRFKPPDPYSFRRIWTLRVEWLSIVWEIFMSQIQKEIRSASSILPGCFNPQLEVLRIWNIQLAWQSFCCKFWLVPPSGRHGTPSSFQLYLKVQFFWEVSNTYQLNEIKEPSSNYNRFRW